MLSHIKNRHELACFTKEGSFNCLVFFVRYHFTSDVLDACDILEKHLKNLKSVEKHDLVSDFRDE